MVKLKTLALSATLIALAASLSVSASDLKDQVKMDVQSVGLHPGLDPGMYVCASKHLHIKAMVKNESDSSLAHIRVAGRAYGLDNVLLGTATGMTKEPMIESGQSAEVDLEFLTITGSAIEQVTDHDLTVVEAPALK